MAFIPLNHEQGKIVQLQVAATTFTKGDACVHDGSGQMVKATAGNGAGIMYVIAETVATTATAGDLKNFWIATPDVQFVADTTADPTQAQMGTFVDLVTNAATLDTSASTDDLFFLERALGPLTDRKVVGHFTPYAPAVE